MTKTYPEKVYAVKFFQVSRGVNGSCLGLCHQQQLSEFREGFLIESRLGESPKCGVLGSVTPPLVVELSRYSTSASGYLTSDVHN